MPSSETPGVLRSRRLTLVLATLAMLAALVWGGNAMLAPLLAGAPAEVWFARAVSAERNVTFEAQGSTVAQGTRATFTLAQGRGEFRLTYTDAAHTGAYMMKRGEVFTIRDAKGQVTTQQATGAQDSTLATLLDQNYRARVVGMRRVAGRTAVDLMISDRQTGKRVMRLSLDREHAVALRTISYDTAGRVTRETQYRQIRFRPVSLEQCADTADAAPSRFLPLAQVERRAGFRWSAPTWQPAGFRVEGYALTRCACCAGHVIQGTYRDGLRTISVFQHATKDGACTGGCACGKSDQGICHITPTAETSVVTRDLGTRTVAVVGELEKKTLLRIAASVRK